MRTKTLTVAVGAAVLIALGGVYGYRSHARSEERGAMKPAVSLTMAYLSQILHADTQPGEMTYGEFYEKTARAIQEIDKKSIELRSMDVETAGAERDMVLAYMAQVQDIIRNDVARHRGKSASDAAIAEAKAQLKAMDDARAADNAAMFKYASSQVDSALARAKAATTQMASADRQFRSSLTVVRSSSEAVATKFNVVDSPVPEIDAEIRAGRGAVDPEAASRSAASE